MRRSRSLPAEQKICDLRKSEGRGLRAKLLGLVGGPLERLLALSTLNEMYAAVDPGTSLEETLEDVLEVLGTSYNVVQGDVSRIPSTGPVVVVANHPFGGIEGIVLGELIRQARPDAKILANYLLGRMDKLRDLFILVDPFGSSRSAKANLRPLKDSIRWLKQGALLGVFPAGEVAHVNLRRREVTDPKWSDTIGRLVQISKATVVPVYFEGGNSRFFHAAGIVHPRLRTALLPREMIRKRGAQIKVRIGNPIPYQHLEHFESPTELTDYLRLRTFLFARRNRKVRDRLHAWFVGIRKRRKHRQQIAEVIQPVDPALIQQDIQALPEEAHLLDSGGLNVFCAAADQIPNLKRELGRLREITFRDNDEGTGTPQDWDRFDETYLHLFIWDPKTRQVIGAYRLGQTDLLLPRFGKKGLYTSTLFAFRRKLLEQVYPALEMGRSFIRPECQRNYNSLLLLWRGIGEYIVRNPRYRYVFGPVSINREYESLSKQLIVSFIRLNNYGAEFARCVRPRHPFRMPYPRGYDLRLTSSVIKDIEGISALISEIEADRKGIPVLLRQYIKLGGRILAFNRDPDFSDVLDGLIYVDLTRTDRRILQRYMGRDGANSFLAHHGVT